MESDIALLLRSLTVISPLSIGQLVVAPLGPIMIHLMIHLMMTG